MKWEWLESSRSVNGWRWQCGPLMRVRLTESGNFWIAFVGEEDRHNPGCIGKFSTLEQAQLACEMYYINKDREEEGLEKLTLQGVNDGWERGR